MLWHVTYARAQESDTVKEHGHLRPRPEVNFPSSVVLLGSGETRSGSCYLPSTGARVQVETRH